MVNTDFICAIKENNNTVTFEKVTIPTSVEPLSTLEGLAADSRATVLDMQAQMCNAFPAGNRHYVDYLSPLSYSDAFVSGAVFPTVLTQEDYDKLLSDRQKELEEGYDSSYSYLKSSDPARFQSERPNYIKIHLEGYVRNLKASYLRAAKRYITARAYEVTLSQLRGQDDIRMYSTDSIGFSEFEYQITKDVKVSIWTNFGYGISAYFILGMSYKGIDILPYSLLVKYYNANMRDLLRYTQMYEVNRKSWETALGYVERAANMATHNEEQYIRTFIMDEVRQMVDGLEAILMRPAEYADRLVQKAGQDRECEYLTVRNMDMCEKRRFRAYPEEMTMAIKSEKVTGALDFLQNLKKLSVYLPEIDEAVKHILEMSQRLYPELLDAIARLDGQLSQLDIQIAECKERIRAKGNELDPYEKEIDSLYEAAKQENEGASRYSIQSQYTETHPEYQKLKDELSALREPYYELLDEKSMRDSFRNNLQHCLQKIKTDEERMAA